MGRTKKDQRREELREQLWPNSLDKVWRGPKEIGYWCAPRVLPLLLHLTKDKRIVGAADCSTVYLELLSRDYGQGIIEINDEDESAYSAGYTGTRARRTWQERMRLLDEAGFIEIAPKGNRACGYVLIRHPHHVVLELRRAGKIDNVWWNLFQHQLRECGVPALEDTGELRIVHRESQSKKAKG